MMISFGFIVFSCLQFLPFPKQTTRRGERSLPTINSVIARSVRSATRRRPATKTTACQKSVAARLGQFLRPADRGALHPVPARNVKGRRSVFDVRDASETFPRSEERSCRERV